MIKFRTQIEQSDIALELDYKSKILFAGSCFTTNIGNQFRNNGFNVHINPFGVLYNPISIASNIELLIHQKIQTDSDLFFDKEQYHNFNFHSSFSGNTKSGTLQAMNHAIVTGSAFLKDATHLFITFGTSFVFHTVNQNTVVANCHKLPSSRFTRSKANLSEMINIWTDLLTLLSNFNPYLQIVLTVSPIRHLSDGLHQNQLSKAQLMLLVDHLCVNHRNVSYFPSYEILLDDLRDYRFYENDLVHPNAMTTSYIWEIIVEHCFDQGTQLLLRNVQKILKSINHKPFNNQSDTYKHFLENSLNELNILSQKYPYLRTEEMYNALQNKLQQLQ